MSGRSVLVLARFPPRGRYLEVEMGYTPLVSGSSRCLRPDAQGVPSLALASYWPVTSRYYPRVTLASVKAVL